jgi:glutathione peroxidase
VKAFVGVRLTFDNAAAVATRCAMRNLLRLVPLLLLSLMTVRAESLYEIAVKDIDGKATTLAPLKGRVLLVVNVASECGYTPQYEGLQAIYKKYEAKGLTVLGFPCNQFGGQEPGTNAEIKQFCSTTFHVTFPLYDKIDVNGAKRHPLYVALAGKGSPFPGDIGWNFSKFLIGRDGKIVKRFDSGAEPGSPEVTKAIETALAAK